MEYGTNFTETEMLLAAQNGDSRTLAQLGRDMLPGERVQLREACETLIRYLKKEDPPNMDPIPGIVLI